MVEVDKLGPLVPRLFKRVVKCISGSHLQIADRAMCFFENDYFLAILKAYKESTFPMLVPVIVKLADTHWHKYPLPDIRVASCRSPSSPSRLF